MCKLWMKKFCPVFLSVMVAAAPRYSRAQNSEVLARVSVPFGFETGSKRFAPGTYTIRMANAHTLLIRSASESGLATVSTESTGPAPRSGTAVFEHRGNRYFLRGITVAGNSRRLYLPPTAEQTHFAETAANTRPATVEKALLTGR
jgi:hypothetical protein